MDIPTTEDCILEEDEEVFEVHLSKPVGQDHRIIVNAEKADVSITDDDGKDHKPQYGKLFKTLLHFF